MDDSPPDADTIARAMIASTPHAGALGMRLVSIGEDAAIAMIPYGPHLVGDPETGVVHGGVITSLLDHTSGMAVQGRRRMPGAIATLDMRIDYMRPAKAGADIFARVECHRLTRSVAFVRGVAYLTTPDDPIASVTAAFMLDTSSSRRKTAS
jgi:uncharacterized protein (TIGR00369 family)